MAHQFKASVCVMYCTMHFDNNKLYTTLSVYMRTVRWRGSGELLYSVQLCTGVGLLPLLVDHDMFPHANSLSNGDVFRKVHASGQLTGRDYSA